MATKADVKVRLNIFDSDHRPVVTTIKGCKTEKNHQSTTLEYEESRLAEIYRIGSLYSKYGNL